jgi:hypothetical protein
MAARGFKKITAIYFGPNIMPGFEDQKTVYAIAGGQVFVHHWKDTASAWIELSEIANHSILNEDREDEDDE